MNDVLHERTLIAMHGPLYELYTVAEVWNGVDAPIRLKSQDAVRGASIRLTGAGMSPQSPRRLHAKPPMERANAHFLEDGLQPGRAQCGRSAGLAVRHFCAAHRFAARNAAEMLLSGVRFCREIAGIAVRRAAAKPPGAANDRAGFAESSFLIVRQKKAVA